MPSQDSLSIVRRFFAAYNQGDTQAIGELVSPDYFCHMGGTSEPMVGLTASLQADASVRAAFSDIRWTIDDLFADGDKVVARRAWSMKPTGAFQGLPASDPTLAGTAIDIFYIRDGQIVEQWTEPDNLSLMQQLGTLPMTNREPGL